MWQSKVRIEMGLCPSCGKPAREGHQYCAACAAHKHEYDMNLAEKRRKNREMGLCACGRQPEPGKKMCRWCCGKQTIATRRWREKKKGNTE